MTINNERGIYTVGDAFDNLHESVKKDRVTNADIALALQAMFSQYPKGTLDTSSQEATLRSLRSITAPHTEYAADAPMMPEDFKEIQL